MLISSTAFSQPAPSAREHFARGVDLARAGEFDAAATEFDEAYRMSPNYAVLYNLGQAYVALGKPVEAVAAFETYLISGGAKVEPRRRQEVEDLVALNKKRIGYVSFAVDPVGSEIFVDGRSIAARSTNGPVGFVVGVHGVTVDVPGYAPYIGHVDVEAGKDAELHIRLEPTVQEVAKKIGQLAVECPVLATHVLLDGVDSPAATSGPVLVAVGQHEVTCLRDGYAPRRNTVEVTEGTVASVACSLVALPDAPGRQTGIVSLVVDQLDAEIRVDGEPVRATVKLPSGPHRVVIRRHGFEDWTTIVNAQPGFPQTVQVRLTATAEHVLEQSEAARARRDWAYTIGGAGLLLVGSSALIYSDNSARYTAWEKDRDSLARDIQDQQWSATLNQRVGDLQSRAASIQGRDDLALGIALVGGGALTYAVASWLRAER